ncbi:hypothetical protein SAY86_010285 [Trapa natans]|uniref:Uncharacterized protein n=1 Tax=Trapa natans TaxID=22666 RepID=A0AAN7KYF6_TRANT|nr:hypothetical protein SAY86_010285 [Trapa natans]
MDIDLLWATRGPFLFFDCMAAATSTTIVPKSRNSSIALIAFIVIFLISIRHVEQTPHVTLLMPAGSSSSISLASRRLLSESSMSSFYPKPTQKHHNHASSSFMSPSKKELEGGAHEVPSGPNPISNR